MAVPNLSTVLGCTLAVIPVLAAGVAEARAEVPYVLVIHGGAGIAREDLSAEHEALCRAALEKALQAGFEVLACGGASLDAVQAAITVLEDAPQFNAGRGAALTSAGTVEMDASIMDGAKLRAGAVAAVRGVRNPIGLARLVMDRTPHVLLAGEGAEAFGRECKVRFEPPEYFITPEQVEKLRRAQAKKSAASGSGGSLTALTGTVGAVALDKEGHLAAATSTGGLTNKRPGRVGDTPIIGAGNYAEDGVCAVSCTGQGEFFLRAVVAADVAARMKYEKREVGSAAREIIHDRLPKLGGRGGLIAVDAAGHVTTPFNTPGMFHGWIKADGSKRVAIFEE